MSPAEGFAQTPADTAMARDLFHEGSQLSQQGHWKEAQDRFERSLKLRHAPLTVYSLGVAQKNLGLWVEALESLRAFLWEPPMPATKPYEAPARKAITELENRIAHISIHIKPPSAQDLRITIDDEVLSEVSVDYRRPLNPGTHAVFASALGYRDMQSTLSVEEGQDLTITITLEPLYHSPLSDTVPSLASPLASATSPNEAPDQPSSPALSASKTSAILIGPPAPTGPSADRALAYSLAFGGSVTLVTGFAVGLAGVHQAKGAATQDGSDASAARTKALIGDSLVGLGAAALGTGVFFLLAKPSSATKPNNAYNTMLFMGATSIGAHMRFL